MRVIPLSAKKVMVALCRMGYQQINSKGSHRIFGKTGCRAVTVPDHKELQTGTLRTVIAQAGLSVEQFYRYVA